MPWFWRYDALLNARGWEAADLAEATGWPLAALLAAGPAPELTLGELGEACAALGCDVEALVGFSPETPEAQAARALASNAGYWALLAHARARDEEEDGDAG